jgi:hypothetical protein
MKKLVSLIVLTLMVVPSMGLAAKYQSSFIENMPPLTVSADDKNVMQWIHDDMNSGNYNKLLMPQPYVILSEKNKYKGIQPDQVKLFADRISAIFITRLEELAEIVDQPGPGVLVVNMALTNVIMKKKRGLLGYTPMGALVHGATRNNKIEELEKLAKKVQLRNANLEVEFVDGGTGEVMGVLVLQIEGKEKGREEESWPALRAELTTLADRFYNSYAAQLNAAAEKRAAAKAAM